MPAADRVPCDMDDLQIGDTINAERIATFSGTEIDSKGHGLACLGVCDTINQHFAEFHSPMLAVIRKGEIEIVGSKDMVEIGDTRQTQSISKLVRNMKMLSRVQPHLLDGKQAKAYDRLSYSSARMVGAVMAIRKESFSPKKRQALPPRFWAGEGEQTTPA